MGVKLGLSLTLREAHTLRMFENMVLTKMFWPKRARFHRSEKDYKTKSFLICTPRQRLFG
jgi:hypothetical protein